MKFPSLFVPNGERAEVRRKHGDGDGRPTPRSCSPWSRRARCSPRPGGAGPCCRAPPRQREDRQEHPEVRRGGETIFPPRTSALTHLLRCHQIDGQDLVESRHSGRVNLQQSINILFCCGLAWPTLCLVNLTFPTVTSNNANFTLYFSLFGQINNFII